MKVVILGAGYAGLTVARRLEDALPGDVELVVVDDAGEHLVRHELHRVIRRPAFAEELVVPLGDVLERAAIRRARVEAVDPEARTVRLEGDGAIEYDYAAVCLGAETAFYDLPGVEEHGQVVERLDDARRIRERFLEVVDAGGTTVVGGAGLSGVQVAGELAELAREEGATDVDVVLLERLDDVAPAFPPNFRDAVREELEALGIDVRTGTTVTEATADAVETEAGSVACDQLVWTGGIRGPAAMNGERSDVRGTLRLGDGTFVVGDAARVVDRDGEAVPASAQAAVREGKTAATNIRRLIDHERAGRGGFEPRLEPLSFDPRGWVVSVGDGTVAQVGPSVIRGPPARALKAAAGLNYLGAVGAVREAVDIAAEEFGGAP